MVRRTWGDPPVHLALAQAGRGEHAQPTVKRLVGLLGLLLAGCVAAQSSPASPAPGTSVAFDCSSIVCSDAAKGAGLEADVLGAVAGLGYRVKSITVGVFGYDCGVPPEPPETAQPCPATTILPTAYVSFVGTDKIATVKIGTLIGDPVISFEVPPPGPSFP